MNHIIEPMLRPLSLWAEHSQRRACRNAMVASTALTAGRRERDEVQEFVVAALAHREPRAGAATHSLPAAPARLSVRAEARQRPDELRRTRTARMTCRLPASPVI